MLLVLLLDPFKVPNTFKLPVAYLSSIIKIIYMLFLLLRVECPITQPHIFHLNPKFVLLQFKIRLLKRMGFCVFLGVLTCRVF